MTDYGIFYSRAKPIGNRLFMDWREIKRGVKKGRIEIVMNHYDQPKKLIIQKSQIKKYPSAA